MDEQKGRGNVPHLNEKFFQDIYDVMTGICTPPEGNEFIRRVTDEFEPGGLCAALYEAAYAQRLKISEALGDRNGEDRDLLELIRIFEQMQYELCRRSFEYGIMAAGAKRV